jgi:hypothetical protein
MRRTNVHQPAQSCPDLGRWRAWLDEARDGEGADLDRHLETCPQCPELVRDLRENATLATALIRPLVPEGVPSAASIELARARFAAARAGAPREEQRRMTTPYGRVSNPPQPFFQRWRVAIGGIAAALVLMAVLGTPQGRSAAAQFLAQFRSERLEPVALSTSQLQDLDKTFAELEQLGTVDGLAGMGEPRQVSTIAEAERVVGFSVKTPDPATLPAGTSATPSAVMVMPAGTVRFTFDQAKARAHYAATGRPNVQLPDRFDGSSLVVHTPATVVLQYGGSGNPGTFPAGLGLLVGQAEPLTVEVQGNVTLEELRTFLLGLPGLSPEMVRQLRAIDDWQNTLPIPIPVDDVNWQRTTVAGASGLLLGDNSGLGSIVIWQKDGHLYGVAGAAPAREVQRVANGLR